VESRPPSDAATALLVTGPRPSQTIFIDRHLASGVQSEPFSTDPARQSMAYEAKWLGASLVLIKRGNAGRGAAPAIPDREEVWSVAADGTLHVDVNDRLGHATTTTHLVYRRVPIPATVRAGDNLLENPGADRAGADWLALRDAKVEPCDGNPCFVVRNQGSFRQTVLLPADAVGKYVVMIGAVSSQRINPDMAITGLPYLYGMVAIADGSRYLAYLQGMLARPITPNSWTKTAGVFPIPVHAARVSFQLNQAERRGTPQNGSAARFDDLGCYLFPTESEARAFTASGRGG